MSDKWQNASFNKVPLAKVHISEVKYKKCNIFIYQFSPVYYLVYNVEYTPQVLH